VSKLSGYTAVMAVAPTLEAVALLARLASSRFILQPADVHSTLVPLAIEATALDALHSIGWRSNGMDAATRNDVDAPKWKCRANT
jgi:hypothetical protein